MDGPVYSAGLELRAAGDGSRRLTGRFPYNSRAVIHSGGKGQRPRKEQFAPKSLSYAVDDPDRDVHLLIGHSFDKPLASKKARTLITQDTDAALTFEAILTPDIQETSWAKDFMAAFAAGLIGGISHGFRVPDLDGAEVTDDENPAEGNALIRTIFAAVLFELSMVVRPAYHETDVSLRSWQTHQDRLPYRGPVHHLNRWRL